jgi:alpha-D-xyloside xylohydrolase
MRVYAGADGEFNLYRDDGNTYAYENGDYQLTHLHWDNQAGKLTESGSPFRTANGPYELEVIGSKP